MNYAEDTVQFDCDGATLLGIVTKPTDDQYTSDTGVIIIVGGPQYRAGSHRQFVLTARHLAIHGYPAFRFDYRGMGDSEGDSHDFLNVERDVSAAAQAFVKNFPRVNKIVLWGLCDGASAALLTWGDLTAAPVVGLCLLNPWVRSEAGLARTHVKYYYLQRLRDREFWLKLFSGRIAGTAVLGLVNNLKLAGKIPKKTTSASFQNRMAQALKRFDGATLLILSGADHTAQEFIEHSRTDINWQGLLNYKNIVVKNIAGADHTFSNFDDKITTDDITVIWLDKITSRPSRPTNHDQKFV